MGQDRQLGTQGERVFLVSRLAAPPVAILGRADRENTTGSMRLASSPTNSAAHNRSPDRCHFGSSIPVAISGIGTIPSRYTANDVHCCYVKCTPLSKRRRNVLSGAHGK